MSYARIDSQGHMIFDDTAIQSGQGIPNNYVVRRLSDVKISPEIVKSAAKQSTDINYEQSDNTVSDKSQNQAVKKVVDLDDGLFDEDLTTIPHTSDIQYEQTKELHQADNLAGNTNASSKPINNAKTPLPKPKTPPKLPD
jgi:hypothetical protein